MFKRKKKEKTGKQPTKQNILRKRYGMIAMVFAFFFLLVAFSPFISGKNYQIEPTSNGSRFGLTDSVQIQLVNRQYNPKNQLLRVDYEIQSDIDNPVLSNLKYETYAKYLANTNKTLKGEVVQVNPKYLIVFIHQLPKKYEGVGVHLKPKYIDKSLEAEDTQLDQKDLLVQFHQEDVKENDQLEVGSKKDYLLDWINEKIKNTKDELAKLDESDRQSTAKIKNYKETMENLTDDTDLMTDEEKEEYDQGMQNLRQKITVEEGTINKNKESRKTLEERIKDYGRQKEKVKEE